MSETEVTLQTMQNEIFHFVDEFKDLVSMDLWNNILLDCSKNEVLILWLLYRNSEVNMTQIAEYIHVPLNTATGIIARMEKRGLVVRQRSTIDKRVVTIQLGDLGNQQIQAIIKEISYYGVQLATAFTPSEMEMLFKMFDKIKAIMKQERHKEGQKKVKRILIE